MPDAKPKPKTKRKAKAKATVPKAPKKRQMLSIIFSFRNEEDVLDELLDRLHKVLDPLDLDLEFIFVNDDSTDRSVAILTKRAASDPCIKLITMSARFGVNPCFLAGMRAARGDALVTLDTDLQDPPEIIPELVEKWQSGFDIVHTTRLHRDGESAVKMFITATAYRIINSFAEIAIPPDTGMFKLISRRASDAITSIPEVDMYLRGIMTWVGFKQDQVFYKREERFGGVQHFPLTHKDPWLVFVRGFFSFTRVPIALIFFLGAVLTGFGLLGVMGIPLLHLVGVEAHFDHWALALLTFIGGANLSALGILGVYLSRTYNQVKGRPEYVVKETFGFEED